MRPDESKRYISFSPHPLDALYGRITRKHEQGGTLQLSPEDLDWFVVSGAYAALLQAVARERFAVAAARIEARGGDLSFLTKGATDAVEPAPDASKIEDTVAPEPAPTPPVFSVKMLAARWGVSTGSVYTLMKSGELPHFKLGGQLYRITREAVEAHEEAQRHQAMRRR
ncbi:helix-turn-helix domain-containing protein [Sphingomonas sp. RT2P30]|uniref:helix-turn-helix domain-containing protein n=1 Tax=Parasphingomonas halimpatiens TaxID=3096162 RepID=UPI002FC79E8D